MNKFYSKLAMYCANLIGSHWAFIIGSMIILMWMLIGPLVKYNDTWQFIFSTSTSIVTLLIVFLIQNSQNRDTRAIQLKLDELIRSVKDARNTFVDAEALDDEQLEQLKHDITKSKKIT